MSPLIRNAGISAAERIAQLADGVDAGAALSEMVIGDDQVRRCCRRVSSAPRDPTGPVTTRQPQLRSSPPVPSSASASSSITTISLPRRRSGGAPRAQRRWQTRHAPAALRHGDREARALPRRRGEVDGMLQHRAQALHDGKAQAQPDLAAPLRCRNLVELAEDAALLIGRECRCRCRIHRCAACPHAPAADNDAASRCVAHGVGDQIEQDLLEQDRVAADPRAARHHAQA